jgi:Uma2 family endonuclease
MSVEIPFAAAWPVVLQLGPVSHKMSDHEFFEFCQVNRDWRIERTSEGDLVIMPPTGGTTGKTNQSLAMLLGIWAKADGTGIPFDSSTGFRLPNCAKRSPDAAWVRRERWESLTRQEQDEFPPLCPDFVVELRSPTDNLRSLHAKMREYIANGATLGWLIDPIERKVHIYQPAADVRCLDNPSTVSGEPLLRGFALDLRELWG